MRSAKAANDPIGNLPYRIDNTSFIEATAHGSSMVADRTLKPQRKWRCPESIREKQRHVNVINGVWLPVSLGA
jgi:hypothetical protein